MDACGSLESTKEMQELFEAIAHNIDQKRIQLSKFYDYVIITADMDCQDPVQDECNFQSS